MKIFKEYAMPVIVLTVICLVVSAALAATYSFTKPVIEAGEKAAADAARKVVLEGAESFSLVAVTDIENLVDAYKADNGAGYVFTTMAKGYGGEMKVITGITADGKISGVQLMDNAETQGIGSQVGEAKYTDQYTGQDSTLSGVNAISGATISSTAFRSAVTTAFKAYGQLAGVDVAAPQEPAAPEAPAYAGLDFNDYAQLLSGGSDFAPVEVPNPEDVLGAVEAPGVGMVITTFHEGYHGRIVMMVGISEEGKITGMKVLEANETQGVGSQALEDSYLGQYLGKTDQKGVDSISHATISSDAVRATVRKAFKAYNAVKEARG